MNKIYLYGFNDEGKVIGYRWVQGPTSVRVLHEVAMRMAEWYPGICTVYIMDNRRGLAQDFCDAFRSRDFVENICFRDICEREGFRLDINY